jgi:hypothetical protein
LIIASEGLVPGTWPHTLGQNTMATGMCEGRGCLPHGGEWGRDWGQMNLHDMLLEHSSSSKAPPKVSTTSPNSATSWGAHVQHMGLWETFHIQNMTLDNAIITINYE